MNEVQNMYYQMRSFRFNNDFDNIVLGDSIKIRVSLGWSFLDLTNAVTAQAIVGDPTEFYMAVPSDWFTIQLDNSSRVATDAVYQVAQGAWGPANNNLI